MPVSEESLRSIAYQLYRGEPRESLLTALSGIDHPIAIAALVEVLQGVVGAMGLGVAIDQMDVNVLSRRRSDSAPRIDPASLPERLDHAPRFG